MQTVNRKRRRWNTFIFFFLSGLITASWGSRIADMQQKLALDNAPWGRVLIAMPIGLVIGILVSSWLVERYGTQRIMVFSCLAASLFLCFIGLSNTTIQLMSVLFLYGFSRTVLNISMNTDSVAVQTLYEKPIISRFHGIWSLACFAAAGFGTLMIILDTEPFLHFLFIALITVATIIVLRNNGSPSAHVVLEKRPLFVAPDRYLGLLGIIAFCTLMAEGVMFEWSVNYFEQVIQPGKALVTAGYTAFVITMAAGRLAGDYFIHRFGALTILMINGTLMASGFALSSLFPFLIPASMAFLLIGLGDSIIIPVAYMLAAKSDKMPAGYAIACVSLIGSTGFLVGPVLIGTVSQAFGMQWAFACMAMITSIVVLISFAIKKLLQLKEFRPN